MNMDCYSQHELLYNIQIIDFSLVEVNLFLDTHPTDMAALQYYHKLKALREKAVADYTARFGPLTIYTVESANCWSWIDNPWPWEREA